MYMIPQTIATKHSNPIGLLSGVSIYVQDRSDLSTHV